MSPFYSSWAELLRQTRGPNFVPWYNKQVYCWRS